MGSRWAMAGAIDEFPAPLTCPMQLGATPCEWFLNALICMLDEYRTFIALGDLNFGVMDFTQASQSASQSFEQRRYWTKLIIQLELMMRRLVDLQRMGTPGSPFFKSPKTFAEKATDVYADTEGGVGKILPIMSATATTGGVDSGYALTAPVYAATKQEILSLLVIGGGTTSAASVGDCWTTPPVLELRAELCEKLMAARSEVDDALFKASTTIDGASGDVPFTTLTEKSFWFAKLAVCRSGQPSLACNFLYNLASETGVAMVETFPDFWLAKPELVAMCDVAGVDPGNIDPPDIPDDPPPDDGDPPGGDVPGGTPSVPGGCVKCCAPPFPGVPEIPVGALAEQQADKLGLPSFGVPPSPWSSSKKVGPASQL